MKTIRAAIFFIVFLSWMPLHAGTPTPGNAGTAKPAAPAAAPPAAAPAEDLPSVPAPQFPRAQSKLDDWKQTLDQVEAALRARVIYDITLNDLRESDGSGTGRSARADIENPAPTRGRDSAGRRARAESRSECSAVRRREA